jgi:hypothetical protein
MEYQAMKSALEIIPVGAYVCFETDSQQCIDGLTKHRLIWEKNRWHKKDRTPVENAELIAQVAQLVDRDVVGFRKIKGHSKDPWNDLADSLAVKGRNKAAKNVTFALLFHKTTGKKEKVIAFPRISLSSHANIHDFWSHLIEKCGEDIGEPEDFEIWEGNSKLDKPLREGNQYDIRPRIATAPNRPEASKTQRRTSVDTTFSALIPTRPSLNGAQWAPDGPVPVITRPKNDTHIPPHLQAVVRYQSTEAPPKEWR